MRPRENLLTLAVTFRPSAAQPSTEGLRRRRCKHCQPRGLLRSADDPNSTDQALAPFNTWCSGNKSRRCCACRAPPGTCPAGQRQSLTCESRWKGPGMFLPEDKGRHPKELANCKPWNKPSLPPVVLFGRAPAQRMAFTLFFNSWEKVKRIFHGM